MKRIVNDNNNIYNEIAFIKCYTFLIESKNVKIFFNVYLFAVYPKIVFITGQLETVSASRPVQMTCQTQGSRPPAKITWWLNGTFLSDHTETVRNNITTSIVRLQPTIRNHKSILACKAENPKIKGSAIQDSRLLNVTCMYCFIALYCNHCDSFKIYYLFKTSILKM